MYVQLMMALVVVARAPQDKVDLGVGASFHGVRMFPDDNPWNTDISAAPVDPNSAALIAGIGLDRHLHPDFGASWERGPMGMQYVVVAGDQPKVPVTFEYPDESDPGPYPIPPDAPIEGVPLDAGPGQREAVRGDRHVLVVDRDNWLLYELFAAHPNNDGSWRAGSGAVFHLDSNNLRPAGWTSADAAGLPILPGLVRYDEVMEQHEIRHALRFTVPRTRRAYVPPATHWASRSKDPALPPMGMRVRLKAGFDVRRYPEPVQVILKALQTYGMFLADNGGPWFISGAHDARWDNEVLETIKRVTARHLEVVQIDGLVADR